MMKALGILVRLLCSLLVLLAVALYCQVGVCNISPEQFAAGITPDAIAALFTSLNWVSITAAALVLLALLRILDMAWNVAFCLSFIPVLFCGLWSVWGPAVALPMPLQDNACMTAFCTMPQSFPVPALIVAGIFALGWLASTAPFRIALATLVSFGLWYGLTFLAHHIIICRWADTPTPAQPEVLAMVLANPWLIAALPGAFFLVYAVLVAFFETFLSRSKKKPAEEKKEEEKPAEEKKEVPTPADRPAEKKPAAAPAPKPVLKKPVLKPAAPAPAEKPAAEKPAAPAPAEKPAAEKPAAPAPAEKPAEEKPADPAPAEKPAEEKPAAPAPSAEKPATEKNAEDKKD